MERRPRLEVVRGGAVAEPVPRPPLELMAVGTGLTLTAVLLGRLPSWRAELGTYQALYAVAFVFYALALWRGWHAAHSPLAAPIVMAVALAARLAVFPVTPTLSDDVYRYVWEGRVAAAGEDPYRSSPIAPRLEALRDPRIYPRINHPELATIYPPAALAGFALVARLSPTVWAMKTWILLHDLALVALLVAWGRRRGAGATAAIAYAWSPLAITEFAGSGHHDPTAMVWLVAALMWAERRPVASAAALAIGTLVKLAPAVALPFLWRGWSWRARLTAVVLLASGLGWFAFETRGGDSGLTAYWRSWANNELLFHYLAAWVGDPIRARWLALGLVGLVMVSLAWRKVAPELATRGALRAGLIVSPVAHPWYFGWAMLLEPLGRSPGWLLLSLTCVLSYGLFGPPAEGGSFHLPLGWRWVEYGVPLAAAAVAAGAGRRGAASRASRRRVT